MEQVKYYIWLCETAQLAPEKCMRLVEYFGSAEGVYHAFENQLKSVVTLGENELKRLRDKRLDRAERIILRCKGLKSDILTIDMDNYPQRLKNIFDPPQVLYVRGDLPDFNALPSIAIVGQRKATPYGLMIAEKMGYCLSSAGFVVVSGMAEGVDSAAHRGALSGKMPTVAVFGTAIDTCFPSLNGALMRKIIDNGAVISEYPPEKPYTKSNFPRRNRIISGLCLGTLVAEAGSKSGSLITARYAIEEGRDVFAVPGDIGASSCEGTNELIREGCARLVTSPHQIVDEYAGLYRLHSDFEYKAEQVVRDRGASSAAERPKKQVQNLTEDECHVLSLVRGEIHIDDVTEQADISPEKVLTVLTMLEIKQMVKQLPGKRYKLI